MDDSHGRVMELNSWGTGSMAHKAYHVRSLAQSLVWVKGLSLHIDVKVSACGDVAKLNHEDLTGKDD